NNELDYSWLVKVFNKATRKKAGRLLYINGHGSYVNLRFLKYTIENYILITVYLPYSTYLL
ncbi:hypothetical protein EJ08DRAFT_586658, partial [Tothia fuscella]